MDVERPENCAADTDVQTDGGQNEEGAMETVLIEQPINKRGQQKGSDPNAGRGDADTDTGMPLEVTRHHQKARSIYEASTKPC